MKLFRQVALGALLAAMTLGLQQTATAQGGGADFTRVVGSQMVNGHWLVQLRDMKHTFIGDFTNTIVRRKVNGEWVNLTREQAQQVVVPGATLAVRLGKHESQNIIAVLIALFVEH